MSSSSDASASAAAAAGVTSNHGEGSLVAAAASQQQQQTKKKHSEWSSGQEAPPSPLRADAVAGKVLLISGGGSGIGHAIAAQFVRHGGAAFLLGRRAAVLQEAAQKLVALSPSPASSSSSSAAASSSAADTVSGYAVCDVRDGAACEAAVAACVAKFGRVDVLCNCAAGNFLCAAEELSYNAFRTVIEIDLLGTFNLSRAAFAALRGSRGSIINISATLDRSAYPWQAHPRAAKSGVDSLTASLAGEWAEYGIRVNGIAPGPIEGTEALNRLVPPGTDLSQVSPEVPIGRLGTKDEMGIIAVFLASDAAGFITGHTLAADGGEAVRRPGGVPRAAVDMMTAHHRSKAAAGGGGAAGAAAAGAAAAEPTLAAAASLPFPVSATSAAPKAKF